MTISHSLQALCLGTALWRKVNQVRWSAEDAFTEVSILGDPTLRAHVWRAPSGLSASLSGSDVNLAWTLGEQDAQYYIYRAPSTAGPFQLAISNPVSGPTTKVTDDSTKRVYMVRAVKQWTTGAGTSYNDLSQGTFATAQ